MDTQHVLLLLNGELPFDAARRAPASVAHIVAADGGARHAQALARLPDIVVGDMDSLPEELERSFAQQGVRFARFPVDKDLADLELAMQFIRTEYPAAQEVSVLGGLGGRIDMTLANLFFLSTVPLQVWVYDDHSCTTFVKPGMEVAIEGGLDGVDGEGQGARFSLVPLTPCARVARIHGAHWPLEDTEIVFGNTWTLSNRCASSDTRIAISEGAVALTAFSPAQLRVVVPQSA